MKVLSRKVSEIKGLEDFSDYFVTTEGDVYSTKFNRIKKLKPGYITTKDSYSIVRLCSNKGLIKKFYVHRLVAELFLLNVNDSWGIEHINRNLKDNSVKNLRWMGRKLSKDGDKKDTDMIYLGEEVSDYIKLVHTASLNKGIPVPGKLDFFENMINQALSDYVNRYGLKKSMYLLENSN